MESLFSRFKNENRSLLLDAQGLEALGVVVDTRMRYHNAERRPSSLDYPFDLREQPQLPICRATTEGPFGCPLIGVQL